MFSCKLSCVRDESLSELVNSDLVSVSISDAGDLIRKMTSDIPRYFCIRTYADRGNKGYSQKAIFCRIANFVQEEGNIAMPEWMFETLDIEQGAEVMFREVIIMRGKGVTLRPHSDHLMDVLGRLDISRTLSPLLSSYGCLSKDSTIHLDILGEKWKFDVVSVVNIKDKKSRGIATINVDLDTSFTIMETVPGYIPSPPQSPTILPVSIALDDNMAEISTDMEEEEAKVEVNITPDEPSVQVGDGLSDYERARIARAKRYAEVTANVAQ